MKNNKQNRYLSTQENRKVYLDSMRSIAPISVFMGLLMFSLGKAQIKPEDSVGLYVLAVCFAVVAGMLMWESCVYLMSPYLAWLRSCWGDECQSLLKRMLYLLKNPLIGMECVGLCLSFLMLSIVPWLIGWNEASSLIERVLKNALS